MSAKTWRKEFYAVDAENVSTAKAGAHCLKKWLGLLPGSLKRHKLSAPPIDIDASTCAYCMHYVRIDCAVECVQCPLHKVLGNDSDRSRDGNSPYCLYRIEGNPLPMIGALREAIAWERKQKPKRRKKP